MEEDIEINELIKGIKKMPTKYVVMIVVICLFYLFYQLGFIYGFNQSFHLQEDYYEEKIEKFCICQEEPHYRMPNKPLEIPNLSKNKEK